MSDLISTLQLIRSENIGPRTFYMLVNKYGSPQNALAALPEIAAKGGKRQIKICPRDVAEKELNKTAKAKIKMLIYSDLAYPNLLTETYDAPPILFYKGNAELLRKEIIGMVGTRNSSAGGCAMARKLAIELGEAGVVVASGLARGIDAEAHKASLQSGTIAVVAGGLDTVYPAENEKLFKQIEEQGLLLGENPIGTSPQSRHFPQRNRIIAGIALGVVVVEAAKKSGSMITADYALREGREVFAVPGNPLDPRYSGTNYLLKNGAVLVENAEDVLQNMGAPKPGKLFEIHNDYESELTEAELPEIEDARGDIVGKLGLTPIGVDEIAQQTELPVSLVNEVLLELEIAGKIDRIWGNKITLKAA